MFPQTTESWFLLLAACVVGFSLGQWIRYRREKGKREQAELARLASFGQKKRFSKKERRENRRKYN